MSNKTEDKTLENILYLLIFFIFLFVGVCVDYDEGESALNAMGYENYEVIDKAWFAVGLRGCNWNDDAMFHVNITHPNGTTTRALVCTGWLWKEATIRFPYDHGNNNIPYRK